VGNRNYGRRTDITASDRSMIVRLILQGFLSRQDAESLTKLSRSTLRRIIKDYKSKVNDPVSQAELKRFLKDFDRRFRPIPVNSGTKPKIDRVNVSSLMRAAGW